MTEKEKKEHDELIEVEIKKVGDAAVILWSALRKTEQNSRRQANNIISHRKKIEELTVDIATCEGEIVKSKKTAQSLIDALKSQFGIDIVALRAGLNI